ncbi:MAG: hypothetical protein ACFB20_13215 [Opitutales bacterium]
MQRSRPRGLGNPRLLTATLATALASQLIAEDLAVDPPVQATPALDPRTAEAFARPKEAHEQTKPEIAPSVQPRQRALASTVENRFWPVFVEERGFRERRRWFGPVLEQATFAPDPFAGNHWVVVRPLWLRTQNAGQTLRTDHYLYPLVQRQQRPGLVRYTALLDTLTYVHRDATDDRPAYTYLRAFPFVYYRHFDDPKGDYFGVLPFGGTVKDFLFYDELSWALFPLYAHTKRGGVTRRYMPFPFVQWQRGNGEGGGALWPLIGHLHQRTRSGLTDFRYLLWPLLYRRSEYAPSGQETRRVEGILPFYAHERSANVRDVTFLYPFFGWRRELDPAYRQQRYFWPLWVQGRGKKNVNRWLPFYAHTTFEDGDQNRWFLFPLLNVREETRGEIRLQREQFLYFLFRAETRTLASQPPEAFTAKRYDLWPLLTAVDNGAGVRQAQFPSLLAPFFPGDRPVQRLYTPLLTLYRYESREHGAFKHHSLLWDLFTRTRQDGTTTDRLWFLGTWSRATTGATASERLELFGGAFVFASDPDGQRSLRLFGIDLPRDSRWRNVGRPRFGPRR